MRNITLFALISLLSVYFSLGNYIVYTVDLAFAQEDWKQEYAAVCAKTQNAMTLSSEELKSYIDRCDKLQDRINKKEGIQSATEKKVYAKRLKMCCDLYIFTLDQKDKKE